MASKALSRPCCERPWYLPKPSLQVGSFIPGKGLEPFFDALMYVAQSCLEIDDVLTHRLEAEVAGLDNARMHGPTGIS